MSWIGKLVDTVGEAAGDAFDTVAEGVGSAGGVVGGVIGAAGATVDAATGGLAGDALDLVDDTVLDGLDTVTGGVVDVDFDDGQLSARVGVGDTLGIGAAVGEDGIAARADGGLASTGLRLDDDGFGYDAAAGLDYGPLPYSETELEVDPDGDGRFHHRSQGTVPTPYGLVSGSAAVDAMRDDGAWGVSASGRGTLLTTGGTTIGAAAHAAYAETAGGDSTLSLGASGTISEPGVGTIGGGVGYDRIEVDGVVVERATANAFVEGYGARVDAGVEHTSVSTEDGSSSTWDADVDAGGWADDAVDLAGAAVSELDAALAGADAIEASTGDLFDDVAP